MTCLFDLFFFFFQAEDGIRDKLVTGVQTCALPIFHVKDDGSLDVPVISPKTKIVSLVHLSNALGTVNPVAEIFAAAKRVGAYTVLDRSEERRVGKECRSRWASDQ